MTKTAADLKFRKIDRGWYATDDGMYAVVADGYQPSKSVGADRFYEGFTGGEWALAFDPNGCLRDYHNAGDNIDWYPTKRDAIAAARRMAARSNYGATR